MKYAALISLLLAIASTSCKKSNDLASGNETKLSTDTVSDIDGNVYRTVKIGKQIWMAENLRVSRYNNGDSIQNIQGGPQWAGSSQGAWCHFGNNKYLDTTYGKLYNWFAVADTRRIAPKGWRVASLADFQLLIDSLGGKDSAGAALKEVSPLWRQPNIANNKSRFSARPGGYRDGYIFNNGPFPLESINSASYFWTTSTYSESAALEAVLAYNNASATIAAVGYRYGLSVRCIKN